MLHNRVEAANAVMDDDNGLSDVQKATLIALFAKDPALGDLYRVVRRNKNVMVPFVRNALGLPDVDTPLPPPE